MYIELKRHKVFEILKSKSVQWDDFARELRIPDNFRDGLSCSNLSFDKKLEEILKKWMESKSRPVSWSTLLDVLEKLEMRDLMREVQELLELSKAESRDFHPTAGKCMLGRIIYCT